MKLTPREQTIIQMLANGDLNKQVAAELGYTETSFETIRRKLYRKCGVKNCAHLVAFGFRNNLIK